MPDGLSVLRRLTRLHGSPARNQTRGRAL